MLHKRCNDPNHEGPRYLPISHFHKQGRRNNKQAYSSKCKDCKNRAMRHLYRQGNKRQWEVEKKRAYSRARSKALSRLAKLTPELYGQLLDEELSKETDHDFSTRGLINQKRY